jgi:hypothetical protein
VARSRALATPRCLEVAITADPVDPGRINIFERWESQAAVETLRSSVPDTEQRLAILTVSVEEYDIAEVRFVFGKEAVWTCSREPRSTDEIRASVRS